MFLKAASAGDVERILQRANAIDIRVLKHQLDAADPSIAAPSPGRAPAGWSRDHDPCNRSGNRGTQRIGALLHLAAGQKYCGRGPQTMSVVHSLVMTQISRVPWQAGAHNCLALPSYRNELSASVVSAEGLGDQRLTSGRGRHCNTQVEDEGKRGEGQKLTPHPLPLTPLSSSSRPSSRQADTWRRTGSRSPGPVRIPATSASTCVDVVIPAGDIDAAVAVGIARR